LQYVDPALPRHLDGWMSPTLGQQMPVVSYGHAGHPMLLLPTAAADYLENERFFLVKAIEPYLQAGRVRLFSINSINSQAWMDKTLPVQEQARRQALFVRYIEDEVVPYIRRVTGNSEARIATSGASFGGFHAANTMLRRPDLFDSTIAMSGFYDLGPDYLKGYSDDNCYFNNPVWYVQNLEGHSLYLLQTSCKIHILTGQGAYEAPDESRKLSGVLTAKGIPHALEIWGHDVNHDWPWWRKMLPYAIERMGW
jgi:esterase/lipase superfamily enzyme